MRIHLFSRALKEKYSFPVRKIPLDAGFTCPNRDGTKGRGGCTYCENRSFAPNAIGGLKPLERQLADGIQFYRERFGAERFIAYYQAYTNTYAPLSELRAKYEVALRFPEVVGISIGTRPDCLSAAVLDLVEELGARRDVMLEIGLESSHDRTLTALNRQHTYAEFESAVERAAGRGFQIATHLIFGLPGETHQEMMTTSARVAVLPIDSVKIHHLYIARKTALEKAWERGEVDLQDFPTWVQLAADQTLASRGRQQGSLAVMGSPTHKCTTS
jgi:radical SAM protein (TIGR01212 family)